MPFQITGGSFTVTLTIEQLREMLMEHLSKTSLAPEIVDPKQIQIGQHMIEKGGMRDTYKEFCGIVVTVNPSKR